MDDYISRQAAVKILKRQDGNFIDTEGKWWSIGLNAAISNLQMMPDANVRLVVCGKWILKETVHLGIKEYMCSNCQDDEYWKKYYCRGNESFCPNCGADMRGNKSE